MKINQEERAARAWPILTGHAIQGTALTYGELGALLGIHHRACRYVLLEIQDYCLENDFPPLTMVVVNSGTKTPGQGCVVHDYRLIAQQRTEVQQFPWNAQENPFGYAVLGFTGEQLANELLQSPSSAGEIYSMVKVRGKIQRLFRTALLKAYGYRCALTDTTFTQVLEACHILPWSQSTETERLDVRNGILLNANHHRLFDRGIITLDLNLNLIYGDMELEDGPYTESDHNLSTRLHGRSINLPTPLNLAPGTDYLKRSHKWYGWEL
ncbi:HNH endonuclease [Pseudomonas anatoliensis]|uniref:HNH endonuclease n=1 Tax=Pseudomonas anatoliensis TaxID=2710589 RepID=UPI001B33F13D|nr:HNH endonuclease [Pseudomonas anatoliensis]MBP5955174.1 HNH endonuclease [Pseudomonas anatoliensis]